MASLYTPHIRVRRTKTAGFQVCYYSQSGRIHVLRRHIMDVVEARGHGRVAAMVYDVPLEVDDE